MPLPNPDELAAYLHRSFPVTEDITQWDTPRLRELAEWNVAVLADDPAVKDVVMLVDERPSDPATEYPERAVTPQEELDNPYDGVGEPPV